MARKTDPLTATQVKNAKAKGKQYNLADGGGLMLRICATGSKRWLFNFKKPFSDKRSNMSLGSYPEVSLAEAREEAAKARKLIAQNIDPVEDKAAQLEASRDAKLNTLQTIGEQWLKVKRTEVSELQAQKIWRRLELHIMPSLGKRPITELTRQDVIKVLRPVEAAGTLETVKRLCQALNQLMTFAANAGFVDANNLTGINKAFETPKPRNMPSLTPERLPELMSKLYGGSLLKQTRLMIELQLHTMTRPNEIAGARWQEIDLQGALWVIPADRMKMKRPHKIPLSAQAVKLFNEMMPVSGHREHVFPKRGDPLSHASTQTANQALKRMGFQGELVAHGLRSLASTILNDKEFAPDIIETALAHLDGNEVRAAYNRAEYLEARRKMMDWWGEHIHNAKCRA
ncbi:integrase domain-containing protein [Ferrimonas aestuarii]|uniref:DUF4102 domain-containing protein n=2 Tax=Ferrimonas aestuarii TaxID=2569539 RepID=A0A4U1BKP9_9GAMM|nr:DUF4102 domain-containing protein [Ferrimonas aestuarii]